MSVIFKNRVALPTLLPMVDRFCRLILRDGMRIRFSIRDLSNFFHHLLTPSSRWPKQALGPRVPRSWFNNLDDIEADETNDHIDDWFHDDLQPGSDVRQLWREKGGEAS